MSDEKQFTTIQNRKVEVIDPFKPGTLDVIERKGQTNSTSNGSSDVNDKLFAIMKPDGVNRLLKDSDFAELIISTGKSSEKLLKQAIAKFPVKVKEFGNLLDDGGVTYNDSVTITERIQAALVSSVYNKIEQPLWELLVHSVNNITGIMDTSGNYFSELKASVSRASMNNLDIKGLDDGVIGGFAVASSLEIVGYDRYSDISDVLDMGSSMSSIRQKMVREYAADKFSNMGGYLQVQLLNNTITGGVAPSKKYTWTRNLLKSYILPEVTTEVILKRDAKAFVDVMNGLYPTMIDYNRDGVTIKDVTLYESSTPDCITLLLIDPRTTSHASLTKVMDLKSFFYLKNYQYPHLHSL